MWKSFSLQSEVLFKQNISSFECCLSPDLRLLTATMIRKSSWHACTVCAWNRQRIEIKSIESVLVSRDRYVVGNTSVYLSLSWKSSNGRLAWRAVQSFSSCASFDTGGGTPDHLKCYFAQYSSSCL